MKRILATFLMFATLAFAGGFYDKDMHGVDWREMRKKSPKALSTTHPRMSRIVPRKTKEMPPHSRRVLHALSIL